MTGSQFHRRTISSALHEYFFEPPRNRYAKELKWKYGFLGVLAALLSVSIWMSCTFPQPDPDRFVRLVVPAMLILNHLSAYFYFGPWFTFPFRLFSILFTAFGAAYVIAHLLAR